MDQSSSSSPVTFRDVVRFTKHYWGLHHGWLWVVLLFIVISTILNNLVVPLYVRHITDLIASSDYQDSVVQEKIWHNFTLFTLAAFVQSIFWSAAYMCWNFFSVRFLYQVVGDALYKVQRFSSDWHANTFAGGTVRKINRGVSAFETFSDRIITGFFTIFTVMIATIAAIAVYLPWVAVYVAFITVLYFVLSLYFSRRYLVPLFRSAAAADTKIGGTLADIMTGIPTIKSFASEDREDHLFQGVRWDWRMKTIKAWQTARVIDTFRTFLRLAMLIGMLGITIVLWERGQATPGDIALVLTCYFMSSNLMREMGTHINDIQRAYADMEDIVHFWVREDEVKDSPNAFALKVVSSGGGITFDRVTFQYKNTHGPVYEALTVDIRAGERIALVGPSGSGKSTFVKLLQRLYDIQGGAITIDGQNIADVTQQTLRSHIALVPQDPVLFHRSLSENIAYGRPTATREEIEDAARQAYAHEFITSFPQGYDTLVGERGVKLSGGERQRVAIARAILTGAPILVMDEATSSLDSVSEHYIQKALENLMRGRTVITIAHRLATIRAVDRILVFDHGIIAEQGTHDALITNPNSLYKRLYDMQALGLVE
jgi:ATP-binding cassette subfamily B protein